MEHGIITSVTYRKGVVYCDVQAIRVSVQYQNVPIHKPHSTVTQVPKAGQKVAMSKLDNGTRFIHEILDKAPEYPSKMKEGELCIQLDEMTKIRFEERPDEKYDLTIEASGDLELKADKNINIRAGDDIDIKAEDGTVTIQDIVWSTHGHPYDWTDPAGSGVTDGPQ